MFLMLLFGAKFNFLSSPKDSKRFFQIGLVKITIFSPFLGWGGGRGWGPKMGEREREELEQEVAAAA